MTAYIKTVLRSIRNSIGRFVAIFAIIALGVGFFAGLKLSMPSFRETGNEFLQDGQLFDFRLVSTIGFDDEDVSRLRRIKGVRSVQGAYTADAVVLIDGNNELVYTVRFHSLTDGVNIPKLIEGRMPQTPNEIVVDEYNMKSDVLGKKIRLSGDNPTSTTDIMKYDEYEVVGLIRSPYYLNFQRGNSDVGSGNIGFYIYAPAESFDSEFYHEVYVKYDNDDFIFSEEYDDFVSLVEKNLEKDTETVINDRFDTILRDTYTELYDAQDELDDKRREASEELEDGLRELRDASDELKDARQELEDGEKELKDARKTLDDSAADLASARRKLDDAEASINSGKKELEQAQSEIDSNRAKLESAKAEINDNIKQVNAGIDQANATITDLQGKLPQIEAGIDQVSGQLEQLYAARDAGEDVDEQIAECEAILEELQGNKSACQTGIAQAEAMIDELSAKIPLLEAGLQEIADNEKALDQGQAEVDSSRAKLNTAIKEYESGLAQYNDGKARLKDGEDKYKDALKKYEDGVAEYEDGFAEYMDGWREYAENKEKFVNEIGRYERELEYAWREIAKVKKPETYVMGRDTNVGYVSFDNDSRIVDGITKVFPVFFFALAALVCSTTMSRMVSDERTQIGTMRALGYSEFAIVMKYVLYSGSASVSGCIAGYLGGSKLFPYVIWEVYRMMYGFADITFVGSIWVFLLALAVSVICSIGVTVVTCMAELTGMPADLIRPKAPTAGKRILLERIPFIWKRFMFLHKVSCRNVFRFKKRMWMMIIGIAGCTSLLITGFGIRDSIDGIVDYHYDNVMPYDGSAIADRAGDKELREALDETNATLGTKYIYSTARVKSVTHQGRDMIRDVSLILSDDPEITKFTIPIDYYTGEHLAWPSQGNIAISSKLADKNGLKAGDTITLSYDDGAKTITARIEYVFENYIFHYAFMSGATYEELTGEVYRPDQAFVIRDDSGVEPWKFMSMLSEICDIKMWTLTSDFRTSFSETMKQLNLVVILVIACAAGLAFIVMFNLNNINISERIREIATLKVMGFNRLETGSYVFRENIILVIIGFIFGIPLGRLLHAFVIAQIEMDTVTFVTKVLPLSYLWSVLFVSAFTVIVDLVMRIKIERIDMAESLKSVE
ncbi:putative ABC transport system permease protein [Ruminococcaceae bacterium YRB3002]|nr:putative ABC transport system permease protein [Ruminococcaceae bacterium YRB3002]